MDGISQLEGGHLWTPGVPGLSCQDQVTLLGDPAGLWVLSLGSCLSFPLQLPEAHRFLNSITYII